MIICAANSFYHKQVGLRARTLIIGNKPCLFSHRMTVTVAIAKVMILMMKVKYSICCGLNVHYKFELVRHFFILSKKFRQLRELARYRFKLVCMKSSEKNRIQNCMAVSNLEMPTYFLTLLAKQQQKSCLICWSILLIPLAKKRSAN